MTTTESQFHDLVRIETRGMLLEIEEREASIFDLDDRLVGQVIHRGWTTGQSIQGVAFGLLDQIVNPDDGQWTQEGTRT